MSCVLKRDPDWLDLSLSTGCGVFSLISEDGHQVSVPMAILLAASPLLRSLVSDLHPTAHGPLVLSFAISRDVLFLLGDILTTGVATLKGGVSKEEVQEVFKMMGVDAFLDSCVISEVENSGIGGIDVNVKIKLEILVKLENVDEITTTDYKLNENKSWMVCKNIEDIVKDFMPSSVVRNRNALREKHFQCEHCDYSTATKVNLKLHTSKHVGVPFYCDYCEYSTGFARKFAIHTSKHRRDKQFKCEYCDYNAAQNSQLVTHKRIHTGERPYKCDYCDYRAKSQYNLNSHNKFKHKDRV